MTPIEFQETSKLQPPTGKGRRHQPSPSFQEQPLSISVIVSYSGPTKKQIKAWSSFGTIVSSLTTILLRPSARIPLRLLFSLRVTQDTVTDAWGNRYVAN